MKKIIINIISILALLLMVNCQEDNPGFGSLDAPTNLDVKVEVVGQNAEFPNGDGSGLVVFTTTSDNTISYKYLFGDGKSVVQTQGTTIHPYTKTGINTFSVTIIASGKGGITTNTTVEVTVFSDFNDEKSTLLLTGGTAVGKKWYIAAAEAGHIGVGQNNNDAAFNYYANYYQAAPFEKSSSCYYDGIYTFSYVDEQIQYVQNNAGNTFFNKDFKSVAGGANGGSDECLPYDTAGIKNVSLSPSTSFITQNPNAASQTTGTMMNFSDGGFLAYYVGVTEYEILSITENRMVVRCLQGNDPGLAWYQIFTTSPPIPPGGGTEPDFANLVWADEFNIDGEPDPAKWTYDIGTGENGWGNQEQQYYTKLPANVAVNAGSLKITAIKQNYLGSSYTSARIKTQGLYDFTYGRIEIKAKLTTGGGTWPALWSLGSANLPWPARGEIDYMEYKGNEPNKIYGTLHYPGFSGGNATGGSTNIVDATAYHVYKTVWSAQTIRFYIDDVLYYTFANNATLPFNSDFFVIMNVAMGGTFGGAIDPAFTQSSMEVDYIRIYQ